MSIYTGRMSRRDMATALLGMQSMTESMAPDLRARVAALVARSGSAAADVPPPSAAEVRALLTDVNQAAWDRLQESSTLAPSVSRAVVVTLYGVNAAATDRAFLIGAESLDVDPADLTLVDRTPVRTEAVVGTRYTLREV